MCFNSKLVRLKEFNESDSDPLESLFQFQTGSIKRQINFYKNQASIAKFQFQTGSIKSVALPEETYNTLE